MNIKTLQQNLDLASDPKTDAWMEAYLNSSCPIFNYYPLNLPKVFGVSSE
ncbi:MAG: hypothetical protein HC860_08655 [Alkalinema sp. RU_4_3]|nr:hypothetical protein [Alkalinema sp. RU_4_3]